MINQVLDVFKFFIKNTIQDQAKIVLMSILILFIYLFFKQVEVTNKLINENIRITTECNDRNYSLVTDCQKKIDSTNSQKHRIEIKYEKLETEARINFKETDKLYNEQQKIKRRQ